MTAIESRVSRDTVWLSLDKLVANLIDKMLVLEYARDKEIIVGETELNQAFSEIAVDYPDGAFEEMLLSCCVEFSQWKQRLKEQLLIRKVLDELANTLPPISHHAIKSYYEQNEDDFLHPARVKLVHIITEDRKWAEALLVRLRNGEDLAGIINEESCRSGFDVDQGLGWVAVHTLPSEVSCLLLSGVEVGEFSDIIESQYGYHIVKVLQKEPSGVKGLLEVKDEIEARLFENAFEALYRTWLKELKKKYPVSINYSLLNKIRSENESS